MSFEQHWYENAISSNCCKDEALGHYEAGAQSRQGEVDKLKQRITMLEIDVHIRDKMIDQALDFTDDVHDENWQHAINCIHKTLKGQ